MGGGGWRWGRRVSGRGTLRPPPALIKPAFPASPILKITSGFLFKDKEACNSIIGLKKKSLMFVLRLKTMFAKRDGKCLKMTEKKCDKPESQGLGNCEAKGCYSAGR